MVKRRENCFGQNNSTAITVWSLSLMVMREMRLWDAAVVDGW